jgi:hypothetical protein
VKHSRFHTIAPLLVLAVLLAACAEKTPPAATVETTQVPVSAQFRQLLDNSYSEDMRLFPASASRRGYHDNDREWNPMAEAF